VREREREKGERRRHGKQIFFLFFTIDMRKS